VKQPINVSDWSGNSVIATFGDPSASFSVTASNVVSYQWQKTTPPGTTFGPALAETGSSLTINNPTVAMNGTQYKVNMTASSPCPNETRTGTLTVNPYQICPDYTGLLFVNTNSSGAYTDNGGKIKLTAFLPSVPAGITFNGTDPIVKFYYATTGNATLIGTAVYSASPVPSWSIDWVVPVLSSLTSSVTYTISWEVSGNFSNLACNNSSTLITVAPPTSDFTTGGGFIWNTKTTEILGRQGVGDSTKNNFGFNVKFNKNLTNLQGEFTTLIRKDKKLYQVKSNKPSYMTTKTNGTYVKGGKTFNKYIATIVYSNAVIKELKGSNCVLVPNCSVGNGTISLIIYDNGEPGSTSGATNDQIGFTVRDGLNKLYYATNPFNTGATDKYFTTTQTDLVGGNLQVHVGGNFAMRTAPQDVVISETQNFNVNALPNPSPSSFNVRITSNNRIEKMQVRVTDVMGRTVQTFNNLVAGQILNIGSGYKRGVYVVELIQGNSRKQLKLVKL
jgi:hypothetical protein